MCAYEIKGDEVNKQTLPPVQVEADIHKLASSACRMIAEAALEAVKQKGFFTLVLSGGETPALTYQKLVLCELPWDKIHLFWGDERNVPPESPMSNFHMAQKNLISQIPIPTKNIHRIRGELSDSNKAAEIYGEEIQTFFLAHGQPAPVFDFILLGMGDDGHTASLFPGISYPKEGGKWVLSFWIEKLNTFRITLLPEIINQGYFILGLIAGEQKSAVIKSIVDDQSKDYPILDINPGNGRILWLIDKSAASKSSHLMHRELL